MMQASFEGKSVWKAGALSFLSSAATYGIGEAFKGTAMTFGNELLRAGAHGLSSAVFTAIDGGNFVSGFASGALASCIGSYAQCVNMNSGLMIASTTAMGGAVAWATGGDFLQGAMQGMTIGLFNHAMHDGNGGIRYYHDQNGNIHGDISEVVVVPSRHVSNNALGFAVGANTVLDCIGSSLKQHGGNSTWGSNRSFYWHAAGQRAFYGNQYVRTIRLTQIGKGITKVTGPVGTALSGYEIYSGYKLDGEQVGYNTVRATADVAGGWAGAWAGLKVGGFIGGSIGAVPGAIIGGIIGGVCGSFGGSYLGTLSVDKAYGQ